MVVLGLELNGRDKADLAYPFRGRDRRSEVTEVRLRLGCSGAVEEGVALMALTETAQSCSPKLLTLSLSWNSSRGSGDCLHKRPDVRFAIRSA